MNILMFHILQTVKFNEARLLVWKIYRDKTKFERTIQSNLP